MMTQPEYDENGDVELIVDDSDPDWLKKVRTKRDEESGREEIEIEEEEEG